MVPAGMATGEVDPITLSFMIEDLQEYLNIVAQESGEAEELHVPVEEVLGRLERHLGVSYEGTVPRRVQLYHELVRRRYYPRPSQPEQADEPEPPRRNPGKRRAPP